MLWTNHASICTLACKKGPRGWKRQAVNCNQWKLEASGEKLDVSGCLVLVEGGANGGWLSISHYSIEDDNDSGVLVDLGVNDTELSLGDMMVMTVIWWLKVMLLRQVRQVYDLTAYIVINLTLFH